MSVRDAVAVQEQAHTPAKVSQAALIREVIQRQSTAFRAVLPSVTDPERFSRLVLTAVKSTPELMNCFRTDQGQTSLLLAAMQAAAVGLEPNTPIQECWLLPRRNKDVWECQLQIGYRGLLTLVRRSGLIKSIGAEVVREGDKFTWRRGLEADDLDHVVNDDVPDDAPLTHAYAIARFKDGGVQFMVLNRRQVEARRAMSDSWCNERARPYSPWSKWPEAMWRKSAIKALIPFLELSADVAHAVAADEQPLRFNEDEGLIEILPDAIGEETPELEAGAVEIIEGEPADDGLQEGEGPREDPAEGSLTTDEGEPAQQTLGPDPEPRTTRRR